MLTFGDFHMGEGWEHLVYRRVWRTVMTKWSDAFTDDNLLELYEDDSAAAAAYLPFPTNTVLVVKEEPCAVFDN